MARFHQKTTPTWISAIGAIGAMSLLASCGAPAEPGGNYPRGPVNLTAPADPGSGFDTTARAIAQTMQEEDISDSPLPVQNRPGGNGCSWLTQMVETHTSADDQLSIVSMAMQSNHARGLCDYSPEDVTVLSTLIVEHYIVVTPASSDITSFEDLMDRLVEDPAAVPIGAGGDDQLPLALVLQAAGGDPSGLNFVAYEGGGAQNTALLNGDISVAVAGVSEFRGQIEAGELEALATMAEEPLNAPLDAVPTADSLGYDVVLSNWRGVVGPPEMPENAAEYWEAKLAELSETDTWTGIVDKNQWSPLVLTGDEAEEYVAEADETVRIGVEQTNGG